MQKILAKLNRVLFTNLIFRIKSKISPKIIVDDGYNNQELVDFIIKKNNLYSLDLNDTSQIPLSAIRTLLPFAVGNFSNTVTVLDVGGGGGNHYYEAKFASNIKIFDWTVLETPKMVETAVKFLKPNPELLYATDIQSIAMKKFDLIMANSSIQYIKNPIVFLQDLVKIDSTYLYITRTPLSLNIAYEFAQISLLVDHGPGYLERKRNNELVSTTVKVLSKTIFESILNEKYDIKFVIKEENSVLNFGNQMFDSYGYFCERKR